MALIVALSSMERPPAPDYDWPYIDKFYHLVEYAILGFLAFRAFRWSLGRRKISSPWILAVTILFGVAFGITDEIHQRFVAMRQASLGDVGADVVGILVGMATSSLIRRWRMRVEGSQKSRRNVL